MRRIPTWRSRLWAAMFGIPWAVVKFQTPGELVGEPTPHDEGEEDVDEDEVGSFAHRRHLPESV